jgi:hypothetical protein
MVMGGWAALPAEPVAVLRLGIQLFNWLSLGQEGRGMLSPLTGSVDGHALKQATVIRLVDRTAGQGADGALQGKRLPCWGMTAQLSL